MPLDSLIDRALTLLELEEELRDGGPEIPDFEHDPVPPDEPDPEGPEPEDEQPWGWL